MSYACRHAPIQSFGTNTTNDPVTLPRSFLERGLAFQGLAFRSYWMSIPPTIIIIRPAVDK